MASQQQAQQFPSSPAQAPVAPGSPQMVVVAAPTSPQQGFALPASWDPSAPGSPQPAAAVAVPVSPNGMIEYSPNMGPVQPVVMVPASPQMISQSGQGEMMFEHMLLPSPVQKYSTVRDGTQTPEIGSDPGDALTESLQRL